MEVRDKTFLQKLARAVHSDLRRLRIGAPLRLLARPVVKATDTDGWYATIGTFTGHHCKATIWLDRFTAHPERKVYYGLYAKQKTGLAKLARAARRAFGKSLLIEDKAQAQGADYTQLAKRLAKAWFGRPIYERYKVADEFLYGVYEYDETGLQRHVLPRLAQRAVDFFRMIVEPAPQDLPPSEDETYQTVENRKAVARHVSRERKSHAATLRKQRDDYICQVCGFDFAGVYGQLGDNFAEAHHLVPLGTNDKPRTTTIDDLVTVCPNCHRMLHRMAGKPKDIEKLRRIVRTGRRPHGSRGAQHRVIISRSRRNHLAR